MIPNGSPSAIGDVFGIAMNGSDLWAVGDYTRHKHPYRLISRGDGQTWQSFTGAGHHLGILKAVSLNSVSEGWAVGYQDSVNGRSANILRWDGTDWFGVENPNPGGVNGTTLDSVDALDSSEAWAVGWYDNGAKDKTLIEHWNGTDWQHLPSPYPGSGSRLASVSATTSTDAWAVGQYQFGSTTHALIEHWDGSAWSKRG